MEEKKNSSGKGLNVEKYKKDSNGKFTKEAMIKYLFEKETGQTLEYATQDQPKQNGPTKDDDKDHLAKY
jgi:hypothetical protein